MDGQAVNIMDLSDAKQLKMELEMVKLILNY